jgi:hypothetical protein
MGNEGRRAERWWREKVREEENEESYRGELNGKLRGGTIKKEKKKRKTA